jgi:hypothetical protein
VHRFRATPSYCGVGHLEEEAELGPGEQPLEERGVRTRTEAAHLEQEDEVVGIHCALARSVSVVGIFLHNIFLRVSNISK